jgi:hypothetical protein
VCVISPTIPTQIWIDVSMDFITGFLKVGKKLVIMVVVDDFSKDALFYALACPFSPFSMNQVFVDQIFKIHGMLTSIILDRDPRFSRKF